VRARRQSEKKTAEAALKLQMEKGQLKRSEEKKKRDAERKKQEEDLRKIAEAEQRKLQASTIEEATVVSPPLQMKEDRADPSINSHLMDMMQGSSEEDAAEDEGDEQRSPVKSKQKKITFAEAMAAKPVLHKQDLIVIHMIIRQLHIKDEFQKWVTLCLAIQRRFSNSPALPMRVSGLYFQSVPPIETQLCCCLKLGPLPIPHSGEMHSPIHGKSLGSL
jgi:hypothetical protein